MITNLEKIKSLERQLDQLKLEMSWRNEEIVRLIGGLPIESGKLEGHDAPCYDCGELCSALAGCPSLWPVFLCMNPETPGVITVHHTGCVMKNLILKEKLQSLCAAMYQAAGAYDMPERFLDTLSSAGNREDIDENVIEKLLPCDVPDYLICQKCNGTGKETNYGTYFELPECLSCNGTGNPNKKAT